MLWNSHILAYAACLARKVCGLARSTWGTSLGGDKLGARGGILNPKVACRACAGQKSPIVTVASGPGPRTPHIFEPAPFTPNPRDAAPAPRRSEAHSTSSFSLYAHPAPFWIFTGFVSGPSLHDRPPPHWRGIVTTWGGGGLAQGLGGWLC